MVTHITKGRAASAIDEVSLLVLQVNWGIKGLLGVNIPMHYRPIPEGNPPIEYRNIKA